MAPKVGVFHPGTQHSWQTALAFQESGQLGWYATSIFYDPAKWPYRVERVLPTNLAGKIHKQFLRRYDPKLDPNLVRRFGPWGWLAAAASAWGPDRIAANVTYEGNQQFQKHIIDLIEHEPIDVLWGYDTASLEVFRWAKRRGIYCVLDRTIGHSATANEVMGHEYARHPEFFTSPFEAKPKNQIEYEQEEIALADAVAVGSEFCAQTLVRHGCEEKKIHVVQYGFDETVFPNTPPDRQLSDRAPIKLLFAGNISPRKGAAYLLPAISEISPSDASLTLVGRLSIPQSAYRKFGTRVVHVPTVSRKDVVRYFLEADCLIFPSLFEGSAVVLREIYGAGLGAVHTHSAGDGVVSGRNGVIVETLTVESLTEALNDLVRNRSRLSEWGKSTWSLRETRTWSNYRKNARRLLLEEEAGSHLADVN